MNPTDQARKEARKQELKKNKKQRQLVRAAVLKGKDPQQLLEELEKIDQMEFNVSQPSPLNEKVLKDKRKKLRETLDRVLGMYHKDDQEKWSELKKRQTEYEHKRVQLLTFYESVKSAQQVTVDEIPLPQIPQQAPSSTGLQIPLPTEIKKTEHTIYSIATALKLQALGQPMRDPPGCPPGPPPDINSDGELDDSDEEMDEAIVHRDSEDEIDDVIKPTSVQQKMVAISGQNVDDFMKEMEEVTQKKPEEDRPKPIIESPAPPGTSDPMPMKPPMNPPGPPPGLFPNVGMRVPPGPPPGRPLLPPGPPPGLPPRLPQLRMGGPPRLLRLPGPPPSMPPPSQGLGIPNPNVLSAAPQLIQREHGAAKQSATISAKPQIRNLSADVTRFVPSTLRVKREDKKPKSSRALVHELKQKEILMTQNQHYGKPTKDDAYMQFMKEMQQLM